MNFIDKCIRGLSLPADIDDAVQTWHDDPEIRVDLSDYLGFDKEEYSAWLADGSIIQSVIAARVSGLSLFEYLQSAMELPMAARGQGLSADSAVIKWLRKTGRLG
ncbi:hypothetical protein [Pseudoxanthomonas sp. JBR18]|uniref:hypothetical protein n=1 Tax=Pseudoxanthomonas sp. JBR18 TaxID=2969308 RepID=UPI0023052596|nr:hypothetical protein [Pseudoxanthomonas sp. JBR18]WCE06202.1 hypothetical protein PJ250_09750 [Pseudoxanthomonas sp. JBR18]